MEKAKETGTDQELMRSMKVSKAVAAMAIPSVISSLVTVVYNMADTFFVGQTGDALQVAAVSLTNPIFILLMAFANMFGMGGSAVASMAMGEGKPKKVKNTTAFITYASLAVGIIIAVILFAFMSPILHIFGANTETYEYAKGYIHYIAWGAPFIIWSAAASFVVRAEGASKEAMIGSMVGTIANIVLDPFHIVQLVNRAFNQTRIRKMNQEKTKNPKLYRILKRDWKLYLKDFLTLSETRKYCRSLKQFISPSEKVDYVMAKKENLRQDYYFYQDILYAVKRKDFRLFESYLERWKKKISPKMQTAWKTLRKYRKYIRNTLGTSYSNGPLEGMNNFIKSVKRVAFGFRRFSHFRQRILIMQGIAQINPNF